MSVVRLVASDEQRRSLSERGGDVDRGLDLSYNGGGSGLPALSITEGSPAEGPWQKASISAHTRVQAEIILPIHWLGGPPSLKPVFESRSCPEAMR